MRKILLFTFVASIVSFSSCKKCWKCGPVMVDHNKTTQKVCDKDLLQYYENMQCMDVNGNPTDCGIDCKVHYESK